MNLSADESLALFASTASFRDVLKALEDQQVCLAPSPDQPTKLLRSLVQRVKQHPYSQLAGFWAVQDETLSPPQAWPTEGDWPTAHPNDPVLRLQDHVAGRLLAAGADPYAIGAPDLLDMALRHQWNSTALTLLQRQDVPSATALERRRQEPTEDGPIPWLHCLAMGNRTALAAAWLARPGMNPNALDAHQQTALFYATDPPMVRTLVACGVDPERKNAQKHTASKVWERLDKNGELLDAHGMFRDLSRRAPQHPATPMAITLAHWCAEGPQLSDLTPEARATMGDAGFTHGKGKKQFQCGVLGHLGLTLPGFLFTTPTGFDLCGEPRSVCKPLDRWQTFLSDVPEAWLHRTGEAGVSDGWLLLAEWATRRAQSMAMTGYIEQQRQFSQAADTLKQRLLAQVPLEQRNHVFATQLVDALALTLATNPVKDPTDFWKRHDAHTVGIGSVFWPQRPNREDHQTVLFHLLKTADARRAVMLIESGPMMHASLDELTWDPRLAGERWTHLLQAAELGETFHTMTMEGNRRSVYRMLEKLIARDCVPETLAIPRLRKSIGFFEGRNPTITRALQEIEGRTVQAKITRAMPKRPPDVSGPRRRL